MILKICFLSIHVHCPSLGLAYAPILETSVPEFAVSFLDFSPCILLGTFSTLHCI